MDNNHINRREFLKTTAGTGLAAAIISGTSLATAITTDKSAEKQKELYGFFDVCCIRPDPDNSKFILAGPAKPIWDILSRIHAKSQQLNAPLLSTTCLGIQRSEPGLSVKDTIAKEGAKTDKAFIAMNASEDEVKKALSCRQIFLERQGYSTPQENVERHAEGVFLNNTNAAKIVKGMGERHWFVFGRGFQYCGEAAAVGLLALGQKVTIIEDAILPAGGEWSTKKTEQKTKEYLKSLGAQFARFDSVLA
jgi:hypothetical protein